MNTFFNVEHIFTRIITLGCVFITIIDLLSKQHVVFYNKVNVFFIGSKPQFEFRVGVNVYIHNLCKTEMIKTCAKWTKLTQT